MLAQTFVLAVMSDSIAVEVAVASLLEADPVVAVVAERVAAAEEGVDTAVVRVASAEEVVAAKRTESAVAAERVVAAQLDVGAAVVMGVAEEVVAAAVACRRVIFTAVLGIAAVPRVGAAAVMSAVAPSSVPNMRGSDRVAALVEYGARCYHHTRIAPVLGGVSKCYDWQPSTFSLLLHLVMVMRNLASPHSEQDTSALSDYLSAKAQV
eukprot:contig_2828_g571